ncbi:MAG: alpha/beta hydrolase [Bdellovibrionales bacterium]|nr:alpha/beta hydrolase [Bdellovibrionales bacterium]
MSLNYDYTNNGKPVLVMLHGLVSSLDTFLPVKAELEKNFSVLLVDQRGHGKSKPEGTDYTAIAMARDLKNILDELQITKIMLLGHSMGARTALSFGHLYPEMVEKMILEDMGIHQRQKRSPERDIEKMEITKAVTVDSLQFESIDDIFKLISPLYSYAKDLLTTKVTEVDGKFHLSFWPHVSVMYGYQGNYTDLTSALTETHFPVLFLNADQTMGSALTPTCIEHIKANVPRAKLHEIKGSGHNVHKTAPVEFVKVVTTFLLEA